MATSKSKKTYIKKVRKDETATFESGEVHPFYGTFALGKDVEWAGRLFVLDMKEEDEEGIGTFLHVDHHSPAMVGEEVTITCQIEKLEGTKMTCSFIAKVGDRIRLKLPRIAEVLDHPLLRSSFADPIQRGADLDPNSIDDVAVAAHILLVNPGAHHDRIRHGFQGGGVRRRHFQKESCQTIQQFIGELHRRHGTAG